MNTLARLVARARRPPVGAPAGVAPFGLARAGAEDIEVVEVPAVGPRPGPMGDDHRAAAAAALSPDPPSRPPAPRAEAPARPPTPTPVAGAGAAVGAGAALAPPVDSVAVALPVAPRTAAPRTAAPRTAAPPAVAVTGPAPFGGVSSPTPGWPLLAPPEQRAEVGEALGAGDGRRPQASGAGPDARVAVVPDASLPGAPAAPDAQFAAAPAALAGPDARLAVEVARAAADAVREPWPTPVGPALDRAGGPAAPMPRRAGESDLTASPVLPPALRPPSEVGGQAAAVLAAEPRQPNAVSATGPVEATPQPPSARPAALPDTVPPVGWAGLAEAGEAKLAPEAASGRRPSPPPASALPVAAAPAAPARHAARADEGRLSPPSRPEPAPPRVLIERIEIVTAAATAPPADAFASLAARRRGASRHGLAVR